MKEQNPFFSVEPKYVSVSKRRFDRFVKRYPRPLRMHTTMICTPPVISCNDFILAAKWPYSDVAHYWDEDDASQNIYKICTNYRKLFKSRRK